MLHQLIILFISQCCLLVHSAPLPQPGLADAANAVGLINNALAFRNNIKSLSSKKSSSTETTARATIIVIEQPKSGPTSAASLQLQYSIVAPSAPHNVISANPSSIVPSSDQTLSSTIVQLSVVKPTPSTKQSAYTATTGITELVAIEGLQTYVFMPTITTSGILGVIAATSTKTI